MANNQTTSGNDVFRAVTPDSLNTTDLIDGGAGFDTLNISAGAIDEDAAPIIRNVERINNSDTEALNLTDVTGLEQLWSRAASEYTNASIDTIFGIENVTAATTVQVGFNSRLNGNSDEVTVALANNADADGDAVDVGFTFTGSVAGEDNGDIEVLNVVTAGTAGNLQLGTFDGLEALNVSGTGNVGLNVSGLGDLETIDASGNSGRATVETNAGNDSLESITTGSGRDTITIGSTDLADTDSLTVDAGAGNDTITVALDNAAANSTALSLTGGAGRDTFQISGSNVVANGDGDVTQGLLDSNMVTIEDFGNGADILDLQFGAGFSFATQDDVDLAVENFLDDNANAELVDVLGALADAFGAADTAIKFNFGDDAYVFISADGNLDATDTVIQLAGVDYNALTGDNVLFNGVPA